MFPGNNRESLLGELRKLVNELNFIDVEIVNSIQLRKKICNKRRQIELKLELEHENCSCEEEVIGRFNTEFMGDASEIARSIVKLTHDG